jgi:PhoH-like ATPase
LTTKTFLIDTSVLLYDKQSVHSFEDNHVVLPMVVLDELDRFKEKPGILGESARYINRYLDSLRSEGRLDLGVTIPSGQTIRVLTREGTKDLDLDDLDLDLSRGDNKIIASALLLKADGADVIVVTKDINLRVKCDALGIAAEDYYADHIDTWTEEEEAGLLQVSVPGDKIDVLHEGEHVPLTDDRLFNNCFLVCKGEGSSSCLALWKNGYARKISSPKVHDIMPRNKEQRFALHALNSPDIPLVCLTGIAGSGKTFLTLMSALDALNTKQIERIVVTRSMEPVGRDIGYLPGDLNEKMAPWMAPLVDNFRHAFKNMSYFQMMIEKGQIDIAPLSYIRGRTFDNAFIIVDEAQNATIHELKTVVTRVGENSKIVLMGDTDQIDTPYIDKKSNGLSIVIDRLRDSELMSHIHLPRGERSKLATLASRSL